MTRRIADTAPIADVRNQIPDDALRAARKAAFMTVVGNGLEFFDFASYAFFATIIARRFFPPGDGATSLIQTFAVLGVGLLARPLGAVVFGRIGDTKGRKFALLVSLPLMGASTLILGLLPTYETIGIAAPILLVCCRLVQGFTAGGEVGNAITFLIEWSPPGRRALYSSLQQASNVAGTLIGSLLAAYLAGLLDRTSLETWGWRLPFLVGGLVIAPVGLYLRAQVDETPIFVKEHDLKNPPTHVSDDVSVWVLGIKAVGATAVWVVNFYVFLIYVPVFLTVHGKFDQASALWITCAGLLAVLVSIPVAGIVSDVVGRKPLFIGATLFVAVFSYPLFLLFSSSLSPALILAAFMVCGVLSGIFAGVGPAIMAELFPAHLRTTGVSIGFGISAGVFGGLASLASETLIRWTGSQIAPSYLAIGAAVLSLPFLLSLKETAHAHLK